VRKPVVQLLIVLLVCSNLTWSAQSAVPAPDQHDVVLSWPTDGSLADICHDGGPVDPTPHTCDHGCHAGAHWLGLPTTLASLPAHAEGLMPGRRSGPYRSWTSKPPVPPPNA
jgi:hypothetical protein